MRRTFREEILSALAKPSTVTELKNKIPRLKSFGTLAYHLKFLEDEKIVGKKRDSNKRGRPVTYFLRDPSFVKRMNKENLIRRDYIRAFLNLLKRKPNISDDMALAILKEEGFDEGRMGDISFDCADMGLSTIAHRISKKGERYLKDGNV